MTTESQVDVFTPAERISLLVHLTGLAMQGILANPTGGVSLQDVPFLSVDMSKSVVAELEKHFREEYADKAVALKAAQEAAANTPRIVVPGGGIIQ